MRVFQKAEACFANNKSSLRKKQSQTGFRNAPTLRSHARYLASTLSIPPGSAGAAAAALMIDAAERRLQNIKLFRSSSAFCVREHLDVKTTFGQ